MHLQVGFLYRLSDEILVHDGGSHIPIRATPVLSEVRTMEYLGGVHSESRWRDVGAGLGVLDFLTHVGRNIVVLTLLVSSVI